MFGGFTSCDEASVASETSVWSWAEDGVRETGALRAGGVERFCGVRYGNR